MESAKQPRLSTPTRGEGVTGGEGPHGEVRAFRLSLVRFVWATLTCLTLLTLAQLWSNTHRAVLSGENLPGGASTARCRSTICQSPSASLDLPQLSLARRPQAGMASARRDSIPPKVVYLVPCSSFTRRLAHYLYPLDTTGCSCRCGITDSLRVIRVTTVGLGLVGAPIVKGVRRALAIARSSV